MEASIAIFGHSFLMNGHIWTNWRYLWQINKFISNLL